MTEPTYLAMILPSLHGALHMDKDAKLTTTLSHLINHELSYDSFELAKKPFYENYYDLHIFSDEFIGKNEYYGTPGGKIKLNVSGTVLSKTYRKLVASTNASYNVSKILNHFIIRYIESYNNSLVITYTHIGEATLVNMKIKSIDIPIGDGKVKTYYLKGENYVSKDGYSISPMEVAAHQHHLSESLSKRDGSFSGLKFINHCVTGKPNNDN